MKRDTPLSSSPSLCILDIEASGFGRHSYPIEVGYVLPDGRACCMLIKPDESWNHWDAAAAQVHGITREMLVLHGHSPAEVAAALNADLAGHVVYCDGWAHDYTWLNLLFDVAGRRPLFKLESILKVVGEADRSRLDAAREQAARELGLNRHRASNDARALQLALSRLQNLV
jgi:DNA polymerase III epsilon subunit-like protein